MSKSTPATPDYMGAAQAQGQANQQTTEQQTWANRPVINTPFGQQEWSVTPVWDPTTNQYINSWQQDTNLTPEAQGALDSQLQITRGRSDAANQLLGGAVDTLGQPLDWDNFQQLSAGPQGNTYSPQDIQHNLDLSGLQNVDSSQKYNQAAGDAIYNQFSSRNEPQFTRDTDALRTQLYNQGLKEGDTAYDREMERLRQSQNDARLQASYQATIGSGQEAQRMQGMDLGLRGQQFNEASGSGAFYNSAADQALRQQMAAGGQSFNEASSAAEMGNQVRQQQISEDLQRRGVPLNEINALLSGQQVGMPSMPGFSNSSRAQPSDIMGAVNNGYQADMNSFNAQQQQNQSTLQGLATLAMMFSDIRLKDDIVFQGMDIKGVSWYSYRYIWDSPDTRRVGVMAHEVTHIPGAVHVHPSGYLMVDYGRII